MIDAAIHLVIAAILGAIVGLERTYSRKQVGVPEFTLLAVTGAIAAGVNHPTVLGIAIGLVGLGILYVIRSAFQGQVFLGPTTAAAMFLVFLVGVITGLGIPLLALAVTVTLTILLSERRSIHHVTDKLSYEEVKSALKFGAIAAILYPIAPDHPVDPWGLVNPKLVLLVVVLVSSISFANLVLMRVFKSGGRVLEVSGLFGGLVHSEATTGAITTRFKENPLLLPSAIAGILLANTTMLLRNIVIAVLISPALLSPMAMPFAAMLLAGLGQALARSRRESIEAHDLDLDLESPFAIGPALKFGAVFLALMILAKLANNYLGHLGVYAIAVFGGVAYAGAITASLATLSITGGLGTASAAVGIVLTSIVAFMNKPLWVRLGGTSDLAHSLIRPTTTTALIGLIALALQNIL